MGYFHHNSGFILEFWVERIAADATGKDFIHVIIEHERGRVEFRISADSNHPDINAIESCLAQGLKAAKESDASLQINEYKERYYLFVTYPDGEMKKYTGSRVS